MLTIFFGITTGALLFWIFHTWRFGSFRQHALQILRQAEHEVSHQRSQFALELQASRQLLEQDRLRFESQEQILKAREQQLLRDTERLKTDQAKLAALTKGLDEREHLIEKSRNAIMSKLEELASWTREEARHELLLREKEDLRLGIEQRKKEWQHYFENECRSRAHTMLMSALERKSQELTKETFLTDIPLQSRAVIPRLIGKEGRNFHTLEETLQVSLIIEEQIPRLLVSAHERQQRAIAKATIEQLIAREKITPVTILAAHEEALASFARQNTERGEQALRSCGYLKSVAREVCEAIGTLEYRSSVGQNVLAHSIEVAELMGTLAAEIGLRVELAKTMGLLHDLGKGLPTTWGTTHASAGKAFAEKWGLDPEIANAIAAHHGEEPPTTEEAQLLPICDRISAQLPGVRNLQEPAFLAMVRQCEGCTKAVPEVLSSWAHYAGSHIELLVRHDPVHHPHALHKTIEEAIAKANLPIPVKITLRPHKVS